MMMETGPRKVLIWRGTNSNTMEHVTVETGDDYRVRGCIIGAIGGEPFRADYRLSLDLAWQVQSVFIDAVTGTAFQLSLQRNEGGQWVDKKGVVLEGLDGCTDIDLSLTPLTNTLPINRLRLSEGESEEISVVYFDLLSGDYKPIGQHYTHLSKGCYQYENLLTGFVSTIETDAEGYVVNYPGVWDRIFPKGTGKSREPEDFASVLVSDKAALELGEQAHLFDRLVGDWGMTAVDYPEGKAPVTIKGQWHFSWVLEGRAIQDVWIAPGRGERTAFTPKAGNRYGTSIRVYDQQVDAWRTYWFNPVNGERDQLVVRKQGDDIVQEGKDASGNPIRWCFVEMRPDSFHWTGEKSTDGGKTWTLENEFFGVRR